MRSAGVVTVSGEGMDVGQVSNHGTKSGRRARPPMMAFEHGVREIDVIDPSRAGFPPLPSLDALSRGFWVSD